MNAWLNLLLAVGGAPLLVFVLWKIANWFVNLHDRRYSRDVEKVHGTAGRPRALPHQEVRSR